MMRLAKLFFVSPFLIVRRIRGFSRFVYVLVTVIDDYISTRYSTWLGSIEDRCGDVRSSERGKAR